MPGGVIYRKWFKVMQIFIHVIYEDCREYVNGKTNPKPKHFRYFRNPGQGRSERKKKNVWSTYMTKKIKPFSNYYYYL